nr:MAG TPA: hypothetical protein [Caudoviricetes sp.]
MVFSSSCIFSIAINFVIFTTSSPLFIIFLPFILYIIIKK